MKKKGLFFGSYFCLLFVFTFHHGIKAGSSDDQYNVGLLIVATGKYIDFVSPLIESARKYFCTNHHVTYFVFTDGTLAEQDDVVTMYQRRLGWPYDTMMRFAMYDHHNELLQEMDYLFACDADMLFVDYVGDEIMVDFMAVKSKRF